jgi:hypothetical protein
MIVWKLDLQLPMQSVPNTTKVVSSNSWQGVLAAGGWFSLDTTVSSTNKTDRHDITEVELKVALNTIAIQQCCSTWYMSVLTFVRVWRILT